MLKTMSYLICIILMIIIITSIIQIFILVQQWFCFHTLNILNIKKQIIYKILSETFGTFFVVINIYCNLLYKNKIRSEILILSNLLVS